MLPRDRPAARHVQSVRSRDYRRTLLLGVSCALHDGLNPPLDRLPALRYFFVWELTLLVDSALTFDPLAFASVYITRS